jgi:RNA polymerase sigma-70 factor (ECF subfamily)
VQASLFGRILILLSDYVFEAVNRHTPELEGDQDFFNLIRPLSEDEKAIFILRFIYEYQVNEIGELLTMKPGTVKSKLSRAMEKLR